MPDRRKISVYLGHPVDEELRAEATRLGRSISWVLHQAWHYAKKHLRSLPSQISEPTKEAPKK